MKMCEKISQAANWVLNGFTGRSQFSKITNIMQDNSIEQLRCFVSYPSLKGHEKMRPILMTSIDAEYKSNSQNARVITEGFIAAHGFCPNCGAKLMQTPNNSHAKDFECSKCEEDFELKAKGAKTLGAKIVNGAYSTLHNSVQNQKNLNLYLLHYEKRDYSIRNLMIIPRYFFTPELIEKRKPLGPNARRAGWVGCNILISQVPEIGRINYIKNGAWRDEEEILKDWNKTKFLKESKSIEARGWLLDTLHCVEKIEGDSFTLDQIYNFEAELAIKHPENRHIKDKLRQQLQFLRDKGIIEFTSTRGNYKKVKSANH